MMQIHSLRPNVTRTDAARLLQGHGISAVLSRLARGPLRRLAPWYVPFRAYAVNIRNGGRDDVQFFAVDAVSGALDLYRFNELPDRDQLVVLETRNCMPVALEPAATHKAVTDKVRRALYQTGFFRLRSLSIDAQPAPLPDVYVPYWVGFFGAGEHARVAIVDAVRRRPEGARVRELVRTWLTGPAEAGHY
jgi:hypothetical protein